VLTSTDVTNARFQPTKFREGYSQAGVDDFLGVVATQLAALERPSMLGAAETMSAEDIVNVRFKPTKFREGYDQDQVDDFLDQLVATYRHYGR
jgi:DivIVA domain-containing protein